MFLVWYYSIADLCIKVEFFFFLDFAGVAVGLTLPTLLALHPGAAGKYIYIKS